MKSLQHQEELFGVVSTRRFGVQTSVAVPQLTRLDAATRGLSAAVAQEYLAWSLCANSLDDSPYYGYFLGDVDNDGRADAITVRPHTHSSPRIQGVFVTRSIIGTDGVERFWPPTQWLNDSIAGDQGSLAVDLEGDGDTDVIGLFAGVPLRRNPRGAG
ncbi:hypothetical protein AB0383_34115 [Amycolatopsis sp. NPDC051373]|uniref:hypothetical protein n=1 Tax=Amycolatopsis sp. NPDC051373 TaxID=3155801 RepID=UPI00344BA6E0